MLAEDVRAEVARDVEMEMIVAGEGDEVSLMTRHL